MVKVFLTGKSLNRFEAERHNDHCLHSTVAALEKDGIVFDRKWETVPCVGGSAFIRVKRYWLKPTLENLASATAYLSRRGKSCQ